MWSLLVASILAQTPTAPAAPAVRLDFRDGFFLVTDAGGTARVNTRSWARPRETQLEIKEGNKTVSWSWKGLKVQVGRTTRESRLIDLPTSPRFFTAEQIASVTERLAKKEVRREVAGLSGWERQGDVLYLLPRWETAEKKGWLEMLIRVDLSAASPWFETVAVWQGVSAISAPILDQLFATPGGLASVTEVGGVWGASVWRQGETTSAFQEIGRFPRWFDVTPDGTTVRFVETTNYGTRLAGMASLQTGQRTNLGESRDMIQFPGELTDMLQIITPSQVVLRNAESGLELRLPTNVGVRNINQGVLVWTPRDAPSQAVLYSKSGLRAITRWAAPARAPRPSSSSPTPPPRSSGREGRP